jgi:hypothetical protein
MKGQKIVLETADWSVNGPWDAHRRLYGLNEFAGVVTVSETPCCACFELTLFHLIHLLFFFFQKKAILTDVLQSLAMQKPGTNVRKKILPHHVFQLQCIVDSLAVSRGWSCTSLRGHILIPPAQNFRPRRDVDLFLDRENKHFGRGYCQAVDILVQLLEKDAMMHGNEKRHENYSIILKEFMDDFVNWLGESKYKSGLTTIPPSRFTNTNSNGLWEYSPFLNGVGLTESLELAYGINFMLWDRIPEPICLIHLHNMLVRKGYIKQPVGLYTSLQDLFSNGMYFPSRIF